MTTVDDAQMPQGSAITALIQAAVSLHEMYTSYVHAGFTEEQALRLVTAVLTASMPKND